MANVLRLLECGASHWNRIILSGNYGPILYWHMRLNIWPDSLSFVMIKLLKYPSTSQWYLCFRGSNVVVIAIDKSASNRYDKFDKSYFSYENGDAVK